MGEIEGEMESPPGRGVKSARAVPLSRDVQAGLWFQSYPPTPRIEGVELAPLKKHRADNGWFLEYLRITEGAAEGVSGRFTVRQISVSSAVPGRINAFHIHPRRGQRELWTVVHGQLSVWLVDCREGSPTTGVKRNVILTGEEPALLVIPPGVAHGYKAGDKGALLLYAMDQQFDPGDPDEGRLPWDYFGRDLWEEDRG